MEISTGSSGLILAAVDTAGLIGITIYFNNKINELTAKLVKSNRSIDQLNTYVRTIDPKKLALLEETSDSGKEKFEDIYERISKLETNLENAERLIQSQNQIIDTLRQQLYRPSQHSPEYKSYSTTSHSSQYPQYPNRSHQRVDGGDSRNNDDRHSNVVGEHVPKGDRSTSQAPHVEEEPIRSSRYPQNTSSRVESKSTPPPSHPSTPSTHKTTENPSTPSTRKTTEAPSTPSTRKTTENPSTPSTRKGNNWGVLRGGRNTSTLPTNKTDSSLLTDDHVEHKEQRPPSTNRSSSTLSSSSSSSSLSLCEDDEDDVMAVVAAASETNE